MAMRHRATILLLSVSLVAGVAAAPPPTATPEPAAAERQWQVDEQGRRFYVDRIEKAPGYHVLENGSVRTPWGIVIKPVGEDAAYYYLRVYERSGLETPEEEQPRGPTAEELATIAASYPPPLGAVPAQRRLDFETFDRGLPKSGQWRNGFRFADMNGDGALDLVHGPARKRIGPPLVFLGDRKGSWRPWTEAAFPALPYDYGDVAVADFDGNGTLDLALAAHFKGVLLLVNDGKGRFTRRGESIPYQMTASDPPVFSSRTLLAVDWDRDGRADVLAAGDGPRLTDPKTASFGVAWYRNRGSEPWERKGDSTNDVFGESLSVADLDGDGDSDLITGSNIADASRLLVLSQGDGRWTRADLPQKRPGYAPSTAVGDFDGDRRQDVAISFQTNEGAVWRVGLDLHLQRDGGAWERRGIWAEESRDRLVSLATGDLDGDGRIDLVSASAEGRLVVLRNDGGSLVRDQAPGIEMREGCAGFHVEIADLDGDGMGDLAVGFAGEDNRAPLAAAVDPAGTARGCAGDGSLRVWRTVLLGGPASSGGGAPR
jgi:hypothetical protein